MARWYVYYSSESGIAPNSPSLGLHPYSRAPLTEDEDEPIAADVEPLSSISRFLEKYSEVAML